LPLSLKCMSNGRALYKIQRAEISVDDGGYLILNDRQPYSIEIASPTLVETFVLWFPREWVDEVSAYMTKRDEKLLAQPQVNGAAAMSFFERYTPHDRTVTPRMQAIRAAYKSTEVIDDGWLEENMRDLLAAMWRKQHAVRREVGNLPAVRAATREELWRRINRARDYLHAHVGSPVLLADVAAAACLSPFHLLRVFHAAFGQTPHQYLSHCRIERAKFLLEKTSIPVTEICLDCGFTSVASFSALFHRTCGMSPRAWRTSHGVAGEQNSKIRKVYLAGAR
jgi:AraC family transcriptional regulator